MKYLYLVLALHLLVGCVKISDVDDGTQAQSADSGPSAEYQAGEAPNSYSVLLNSPSGTEVVIRRDLGGVQIESSMPVTASEVQVSDAVPVAGSNYEYEFGKYVAGNFVSLGKLNFQVPLDIDVPAGVTVDLSHFNFKIAKRIFLKEGAVLTSMGANISLELDQIISENGILETFPANAKATVRESGHAGGKIKIHAKQASGKIKVYLRGEEGGDGGAGLNVPHRAANGQQGEIFCALRGIGHDGLPGADGVTPGGDGENGKRGGDSGIFIGKFESATQFSVEVFSEPGLGGRGGAGGLGELGGEGGIGIEASPGLTDCGVRSSAAPGLPGKNAPSGREGRDGERGSDQGYCVNATSSCPLD